MAETASRRLAALPGSLIREALWHVRRIRARLVELPAVARSVRAVVILASGLRTEPITLRAAALTYLTFLSLVPLLAVVFSIFQAVVGTETLKAHLSEFIVRNLAVGVGASFATTLDSLVARASGTAIGGVGFAFLVGSSISLMANVESAFNHTFRAARKRPLALRFGIYWSLLTLGPILLSLSIAATALVQSSELLGLLGPLKKLALYVAPFLATYLGLMLLYLIMPAVYVQRRAAMLGALVAGTAWETAKIGYASISAISVRQSAIYGSLSALPIFLVWVYVSWIIVLFGARIAYAAQARAVPLDATRLGSPLGRELFAALTLHQIARAFSEGEAPDEASLGEELGAPEETVRKALGELETAGLIRAVAAGGFVPARPLAHLRLSDAREAVRGDSPASATSELVVRWAAADAAANRLLDISLEELLQDERANSLSSDSSSARPKRLKEEISCPDASLPGKPSS